MNLSGPDDQIISLLLLELEHHIYLPLPILTDSCNNAVDLSASSSKIDIQSHSSVLKWPEVRNLDYKVHSHVFGHSSYADMNTLLDPNGALSDDTANYLSDLVSRCGSCRVTSLPTPSRKVSLSSLNRHFNYVVCVYHLLIEGVRVFHAMDASTRHSAVLVCNDLSLSSAVHAFETVWLSPFWPPSSVHGYAAFKHDEFTYHPKAVGIYFRPVPPTDIQRIYWNPHTELFEAFSCGFKMRIILSLFLLLFSRQYVSAMICTFLIY